jgi:hypothetical protein
VPRRAVEQPESELVLELTDQQAQPRWSNEERFCGPREVVVLSDEEECT